MEEIKTPKPDANYIELSEDANSVGNIFNELSWELGELDFAEKSKKVEIEEKNPLRTVYLIGGYLLWIGIIITALLTLDVFARSSQENSLFSGLPVCPYLSFDVVGYDNAECKTVSMIFSEQSALKEKLEKNIASNLIILVPKLMASLDIANSPKVQFIQEHTGDARASITDAIKYFQEIKNRTTYEGKDIECSSLSWDESGKFSVSCQVYGGAIIVPTWTRTITSRETALAFLDRLTDPASGFQVLSYPKTLDISEFNSTDGIKNLFSTKTSLDLKLQYLPANKM